MDDLQPRRTPVDPDGLMEFSVVFTDRSLNHMSKVFQGVMRDLADGLKQVYGAETVAIVPGGGTYAMEAVARQFGGGAHALILRNGWFSFRWTQIFEAGGFAARTTVERPTRDVADLGRRVVVPAAHPDARVRVLEAADEVVAGPGHEHVASLVVRRQLVVAGSAEKGVLAGLAVDVIRSVTALDRVVAGAAEEATDEELVIAVAS